MKKDYYRSFNIGSKASNFKEEERSITQGLKWYLFISSEGMKGNGVTSEFSSQDIKMEKNISLAIVTTWTSHSSFAWLFNIRNSFFCFEGNMWRRSFYTRISLSAKHYCDEKLSYQRLLGNFAVSIVEKTFNRFWVSAS